MQPQNLTYDQQQDYESHAPYLKIWVALLVLTVLEYGYARAMAGGFHVLVVGLLALALMKAVLVGLYFMHVRFEGRWVYFFIIPVTILAAVLVIALVPDIAMETVGTRQNGDEVFHSAPLDRGWTGTGAGLHLGGEGVSCLLCGSSRLGVLDPGAQHA